MKTVLRPPEGVQDFTFAYGCGRPHHYDGAPIDCPACVEHVRSMAPDERVSHPSLRAPIVVTGENPAEMDAMRREAEAKRQAASWRLEDKADAVPPLPDTSEAYSRAYLLGRMVAEADLPRANPFDGRTAQGKDWAKGYDSLRGPEIPPEE